MSITQYKVIRKPGESIESLIRRFSRSTKGIVKEATDRTYFSTRAKQRKRRREKIKSIGKNKAD